MAQTHVDFLFVHMNFFKTDASAPSGNLGNIKLAQKYEFRNLKHINYPPSWCTPFVFFAKSDVVFYENSSFSSKLSDVRKKQHFPIKYTGFF